MPMGAVGKLAVGWGSTPKRNKKREKGDRSCCHRGLDNADRQAVNLKGREDDLPALAKATHFLL